MGELDGEVALVTGGGNGIGRAIALRLAAEGARVAICGRRPEPLEAVAAEAPAGAVLAVPADHSDEGEVERLFALVAERLGPLGVLVNNAAIPGPVAPIWEQTLAGWEATIAADLTGPWLCCRAAARTMMAGSGGRIVNVGSITGKRPLATRSPYAAAKLGLVALTRTLAVELGPHGVRVNNVSPGGVDTERLDVLAAGAGIDGGDFRARWARTAATGRLSTPGDIAEAVLFLASARSANITGVDLNVDGGLAFQ